MLDVEKRFLEGACDLHIHTGPDTYHGIYAPTTRLRLLDGIEAASEARAAGMRAILLKCVDICTVDRAYCARRAVPELEVFGELNMSYTVGGLNAAAIRRSVKFGPGPNLLKMVMLPADEANPASATRSRRLENLGKPGIVAVKNGEPVPEMHECLEEIAANHLILGCPPRPRIVNAAKETGVDKIAIQHPEYQHVPGQFDLEKELVGMGAYLELCLNSCMPPKPRMTYSEYALIIQAVGADRCVLVSDMGQIYNPSPVQGLRMLIVNLLNLGISAREINTMVQVNPLRLLGLE
jgi:hypothetical protein